MLLKRELGPKSWAIKAVMRAESRRRGSGLPWAALWLQIRADLAWILLQKEPKNRPRSSHDRPRLTTIERRSCSKCFGTVDRSSWNGFHAEGTPISARSRHDRGSIGPRSWCSSTRRLQPRIGIRRSRFPRRERNAALHRSRRITIDR